MLFSSIVFIFAFLPIVLLGFHLLGRLGRKVTFGWLGLASLFFYGYWSPKFLLLLGASILANFITAQQIARTKNEERKQSAWLWFGVCANLGVLIYFKYLFPLLGFMHNTGILSESFGTVILPLGISFFTFTQIAYLIDLKQGVAEPQDLISYNLFVTFFPHLIAGPIVHHSEMMPQFTDQRRFGLKADDVALGVSWFVMGLFKKVMIADRISPTADMVFTHPQGYGLAVTWVGVLCYSMQLYFDFSGYSDMALGLARMFSIRFPLNFNSPYKAANIIDFWQRWHMTLTRYLTLYVYNPVALWVNRRRIAAGKKTSKKATQTAEGFLSLIGLPTILTMFLAGIWHGAGLQFLLFGIIHGIYLSLNHAWRLLVSPNSPWRKLLPTPVSVLLTYGAVLIPQVFFRSNSSSDAMYIVGTMCGLHGKGPGPVSDSYTHAFSLSRPILLLVACYFIVWAFPNTQELLGQTAGEKKASRTLLPSLQWRPTFAWGVGLAAAFFAVLLFLNASTSFLYFQF
jgi:alginate O-acetyltransferase complex protein AlgI